ncbi:MAG: recombinase family protein [Pseudomonadota bacterium]
MKSCFAYVRVSTVKQGDGVSLEAQRDAIEAFAARHEIVIAKWFEEKETAAKRGRPVFTKMVGELMRGNAAGLIVHKIDRSARNFADWAKIGDLSDAGIDIYFANENLDFRSRGGRLTADIQAVIAADYVRNLREECIKGIYGRLKQGLYPFGAPLGYLDNGGGKPKTIDPVKGPLIRTLFELYAAGNYSQAALVPEMHRRGLRNRADGTVTKTGIEEILRNPFYIGIIRIKRTGETFSGAHKPLISQALFDQVTAVRKGREIKKVTKHNHRYHGLFRCGECRRGMIPELQKGHVYYRCQTTACPTRTVREEVIEQAITDALQRYTLTGAQAASLRERFAAALDAEDQYAAATNIDFEMAKLDERLSRLTDKLLDGVLDDDAFSQKKAEILHEQARWRETNARRAQKSERQRRFEQFLELAKNLYLSFGIAGTEQKREIAKLAFSNRSVRGKNVYLEPSFWLGALQNASHTLCGPPHSSANRTSDSTKMLADLDIDLRIYDFPLINKTIKSELIDHDK